jgi:hypothetical protein
MSARATTGGEEYTACIYYWLCAEFNRCLERWTAIARQEVLKYGFIQGGDNNKGLYIAITAERSYLHLKGVSTCFRPPTATYLSSVGSHSTLCKRDHLGCIPVDLLQ